MVTKSTTIAAGLFGLVALAGIADGAQAQRGGKVVVEAGTVVAVRLEGEVSSLTARKGDPVSVKVVDKATDHKWGSDSLPAGSKLKGYVFDVKAKHDKTPGVLQLVFDKLVLPDRTTIGIQGYLISLDNKSITTKDGRLIANKTHSTDRLTYVGYGAGAGALVGLVTSRKHTLEDSLLGAGAGYLLGSLAKGNSPGDVKLKSGTQMGVRLNTSITYSR